MFRPEITVVDCTIRDGGLMNNSKFSFEIVRAVYKAVSEAGVDIVELGYRNSKEMFSTKEYGPWRFCDDDKLKKAIDGVESNTKLAVMMDAHKSSVDDIKPKEQSPIDIIRVATYVKDIDKAIKTANAAVENGYQATINVMAISHAVDWELDEALAQIQEETKVIAVYIVDSFGALYSEDIDFYYDKYRKYIKNKEVGVHCHNQQQLAFANTIQGIIRGANYVDGTLYGIGRAAGNCPLELLMSFLKNPKFDIRPILDVIGKYILPIKEKIEWGYNIPYMIAGILNLHPQDSMELLSLDKDDPKRNDFRTFYEECLDLI
jgi:4-hydroxy 2-oxovalerate aldolase